MERRTLPSSTPILFGLFLAAFTAIVFLASGTSTAASTALAPSSPGTVESCENAWGPEPAPDPGPPYQTALYTTDAVSANDIWAVGRQRHRTNGLSRGYVVHWNGAAWSEVPIPSAGTNSIESLSGVAAIASNNVWISGQAWTQATGSITRILRWNGSSFSVVPSPSVPGVTNYLNDIVAVSASNIWAVGYTYTGSYPNYVRKPLALRWNGSVWSIVPMPDLGTQNATLNTVTATGSSNVWAIGNSVDSSGGAVGPISFRWNGTSWTQVPMAIPPSYYKVAMNGSAAIASNDVWAVGNYTYVDGDTRPLAFHWNGSAWSIVPTPYSSDWDELEFVNDISALASNDVWAVGFTSLYGTDHPFYMHWNGTSWTRPFVPWTSNDDGLGGVVMIAPNDAWAVGYEELFAGTEPYHRPIIHRYTYRCATPTPTNTSTPTNTPTNTPTPTPIPPRCPQERFTDVCPGDYFYAPVLYLNDRNIVNGYNTSPPCINSLHIPCFAPYNGSTRGQIAKIVSLAAGFNEPVSGQTFADVTSASPFYEFVERMASRGIISGYPCGGEFEPCIPPTNLPYFRVGNPVTRGQLAKMTAGAFGFNEPVSGQTFEDVPPANTFYEFVQRIAGRDIIQGYICGGGGEPCVPPNNRPYFRPNNPVTRGQSAKIVQLTMLQPTPTPTPSSTPTAPPTSTATPTVEPTGTPAETPTESPTETPTGEPTLTPTPPAAQATGR